MTDDSLRQLDSQPIDARSLAKRQDLLITPHATRSPELPEGSVL